MARNKLLTEGEIRQFMKLANLRPISKVRLSEMGSHLPGAPDEDEELESELDATEDELGAEDSFADEEGDELGDMEMDMDMDAELDDPVGGEPLVDDEVAMELATGFADLVSQVLGVDVEATDEPDIAPEEVEDVDIEADVDMGPEGGEEVGLEMSDEEEVPGSRDMYESQEQIVAEVAKRVAARLQRESRKEQMVDQLAERIMKRLTNK